MPHGKYDEEHMKSAKTSSFIKGVILWAIGLFVFVGVVAINVSPKPPDNRWKDAYHTLVCKNRGLELNLRNADRWCMDPKTKAIYEIEE